MVAKSGRKHKMGLAEPEVAGDFLLRTSRALVYLSWLSHRHERHPWWAKVQSPAGEDGLCSGTKPTS